MNITKKSHVVEVWGEFACFSRAEMKVERFSYPCPTPSAARGIFEAIYFKPQFFWQIEKIEILTKPEVIALRRNEVASVISTAKTEQWIRGTSNPEPLMADDSSQRQQRQTIAIRNPHYRLHAMIVPRKGYEKEQTAYDEQFVRRASLGKVWQQPYFGCREFVAYYRYLEKLDNELNPVNYSQDLGFMLYDVFDLRKENDRYAKPFISLFAAKIVNGVLDVPPFDSEDVRKPETERRAG